MDVIEYLLDGLEAELELERELGVRTVECDRGLLRTAVAEPIAAAAPGAPPRPVSPAPVPPPAVPKAAPRPAVAESAAPTAPAVPARPPSFTPQGKEAVFVFLHDRPLSPGGNEMMAKIITALGHTAETAPIVIAPPIPRAKVYVVLGGLAMRRYFPEMKGEPGQWRATSRGTPVLITYSPEYILRFKEMTPALKKIKQDMWQSLKGMLKRV